MVKLGLWMAVLSFGDTLNRIHACTVKPYVLNSVISGTFFVTDYNIYNTVRFLALFCLKLHRRHSRQTHLTNGFKKVVVELVLIHKFYGHFPQAVACLAFLLLPVLNFLLVTSTINQKMHLHNFHLKHFKTLKTTSTCFDLFRSSSGSFVVPC